ncbi:MAG: thrombospondin type 3 repeat-containing protein [Myxococcales bacterium]|nr:thrombospondin type 3 repeat-containing protein [Myxococcales bacterium]MDH3484860.1 thrombospondin type 3 repeat-containing protein [Myxococcales bacterium]
MFRKTINPLLVLAVLSLGCGDGGLDPAGDEDGDGLSNGEEATLGTDPRDADSDRDGIEDGVEVNLDRPYSLDGTTTTAVTRTDPITPTVLVELDYVSGFRPNAGVFLMAENAFAHAGMEIRFMIDDASPIPNAALPTAPGPWTLADLELLLLNTDDPSQDIQGAYLHVIVVPDDNTSRQGTTHHGASNNPSEGNHGSNPDPRYAGSFIFIDTIANDYNINDTIAGVFSNAGITADHLIAKTLIHEIGHALGCTEEGSSGGIDTFNVMAQSGQLGNPNSNVGPWRDNMFGLDGVGHPTFSEGSLAQMDLTMKLSVDTGGSPARRFFDMGTSASPIRPDYRQVTEATAFDESVGYGWESPLPTVSSTSGSDPSDERFADYVAGDPDETSATRFRVSALGTGPVDVFFRLGAQVSTPVTVGCELRHPEFGVEFQPGTIDSTSTFVATPSSGRRAFPVVESTNALGYGRGDLVLECLNDNTYGDAPIEIANFTKRAP